MFMLMSWLKGTFWRIMYPFGTFLVYKCLDLLPKHTKFSRWKRARTTEKLNFVPTSCKSETLLFVCPSLGEYESIKTLIELFKAQKSERSIELAFFSLSGYEPLKNSIPHPADYISLLPADTKDEVETYFQDRNISEVIISGLAIWPLFLSHLSEHSIPYSFVSARTKNGFFKSVYYRLMIDYLQEANHTFVVNEASFSRLSNLIGSTSLRLTGDPRVQGILDLKPSPIVQERLSAFQSERSILVFGSTHQSDEALLLPLVSKLAKVDWKIIIAPHEVNRCPEIATHLPEGMLWSDSKPMSSSNILIIDKIGILKYCYAYSKMAYVGGGFENSLHNILEPLLYENFVVVGPHLGQSLDAMELKNKDAIHIIQSAQDFLEVIEKSKNTSHLEDLKSKIKEYIEAKPNATESIFKVLVSE